MPESLRTRAERSLGQGCSTFSKHWQSYINGPNHPTHVVSNDGLGFRGDNGQYYVDCGGLGSSVLYVDNNYSLPCKEEVELAEQLNARLGTERIKFLKTGSDACMQAVRFAKAHTGRGHVVWAGYHGTADVFISCERPAAGVPHMHSTKFKDIHKLAAYAMSEKFRAKPPACVIWEPMILEDNRQVVADNRKIIEACKRHGVVSIMDEIVTGCRTPNFCVRNYYELDPDLITMGKALGNGIPLSFIAGRADILDNRDVFCSNTHNGSKDAMLAGLETLQLISDGMLNSFWLCGAMLITKLNEWFDQFDLVDIKAYGVPTRWTWKGDAKHISRFWKGMADQGFWCSISMFPKLNWIENDVFGRFLEAARKVVRDWDSIDMTNVEGYRPWFSRY